MKIYAFFLYIKIFYIFSGLNLVKSYTFSGLNYKLKIQSRKEISSLKALFTYNILFLIYTLFKVNIINNCRINSNYSLAFKLETISIVLIFLANNLFITYETKTVPIIAYT